VTPARARSTAAATVDAASASSPDTLVSVPRTNQILWGRPYRVLRATTCAGGVRRVTTSRSPRPPRRSQRRSCRLRCVSLGASTPNPLVRARAMFSVSCSSGRGRHARCAMLLRPWRRRRPSACAPNPAEELAPPTTESPNGSVLVLVSHLLHDGEASLTVLVLASYRRQGTVARRAGPLPEPWRRVPHVARPGRVNLCLAKSTSWCGGSGKRTGQ
jgi:hypothetical protein